MIDGGVGVLPSLDGASGTDGDLLDSNTAPRSAIDADDRLASLVAQRLDARGGACDPTPCILSGGSDCDADLNNEMSSGIDRSKLVLVFINYLLLLSARRILY